MFNDHRQLLVFTALASLLLSAWCVWLDPIINNDGVLYLRVAEAFYAGDSETAFGLYQWPLYPYLISLVKTLSPISIEYSAHLLNAFLYVLVVWGFLTVVYELGADRRTLIIAALVILLFPTLNKYRPYLIRDPGFLAAYLWSLACLFRFWKRPQWRTALCWFLCALLAFLFRVEGMIFLLLVPIAWLWVRFRSPAVRIPMALVSLMSLVLVGWGFLLWLHGPIEGVSNQVLASPWLHAQASWMGVVQETLNKIQAIKQEFLNQGSEHFAIVVYIMTLLLIVLWTVAHRLAIVYAGLVIYALASGAAFPNQRLLPVWWYLVFLNVIALLVFTFTMTFLSGRYVIALVLTLMLAVPFGFNELWMRHLNRRHKRWVLPAIVLLCVVLGLRGLDVATKKIYLKTAGQWISNNLSPDARVYFTNKKLIYYSGFDAYREGARYNWAEVMHLVNSKAWNNFDYLVAHIGRGQDHRVRQLNLGLKREAEKMIKGEKGGQVLIFNLAKNQ